jgi:hypothetical protein
LDFCLYPLRFSFVAREPICFPPGKPGNILRGGFGTILRRIACVPGCPGARECELRASCAYARLFEPVALGAGPSGLTDWPRPFVFRATHLDGSTLAPGADFWYELNLFDTHGSTIAYLVSAFAELGREGMGPGRGHADLATVSLRHQRGEAETRLFEGGALLAANPAAMRLSLEPTSSPHAGAPPHRVRVRFLTPTELKSARHGDVRPEFHVLASRIRDRVSTLRSLYGEGPLAIDFRAFGERAAKVKMTRCEIRRMDATRRSGRTGQVHPIGGFVGEVEYEGELGEFLPYLRAAKWTGVGRQTSWGKGEIGVEEL